MSGEILPDRPWRASAWFPAPGQETGQYAPGQHLADRLTEIRKILPLPLEQVVAPDMPALQAFSAKIRDAGDGAGFIQLAHRLSSRELNLVFPLLASLDAASRADIPVIDRLTLVIRERACPTLYTNGWLVFQKAYPARLVARSLHILCKILEIKLDAGRAGHPAASPAGPASPAFPPLISQIASPESRTLVRRLIRHLDASETALAQFMTDFQIQDNLPFGAELIAQAFISGDGSIYQDGQQLLGKALKQAGQPTQVALLRHFFSRTELPLAVRNRCCQQIYRQFGDPAADSPVWRQLPARDRKSFSEWVFAATIGSHCRRQPPKARLYQRYASHIRRIERWDDDTLLIHFERFLIADSRRSPMLAIYYDRAKTDGHPFELASQSFRPNPADPAIPHRQVDDAIRSADFTGTIGLPFDSEGIRLTGTFLGLCLRDRPMGLLSRIPRLWQR